MGGMSNASRDSLDRQEETAQTKRDEIADYMKERQKRLAGNEVVDDITGDGYE